jgi:hypothetical protein
MLPGRPFGAAQGKRVEHPAPGNRSLGAAYFF